MSSTLAIASADMLESIRARCVPSVLLKAAGISRTMTREDCGLGGAFKGKALARRATLRIKVLYTVSKVLCKRLIGARRLCLWRARASGGAWSGG